jgi:hypothetical protein
VEWRGDDFQMLKQLLWQYLESIKTSRLAERKEAGEEVIELM